MTHDAGSGYAAFAGGRILAQGDRLTVALAVRRALDQGADRVLAFEEASGRQVDFDLRGSEADIAARLREPERSAEPPRTGRGRPRLGVIAREVTLLPRHWDWLAQQRGGASATLRRLVDEARNTGGGIQQARQVQDATYHVMSALAGDLPGFEEAARALYAADYERVAGLMAGWPADVAGYVSARLSKAKELAEGSLS